MNQTGEKQIPLLDLKAQHQTDPRRGVGGDVRVVDSQKFILGEDVKKLERRLLHIAGRSMRSGALPVRMR